MAKYDLRPSNDPAVSLTDGDFYFPTKESFSSMETFGTGRTFTTTLTFNTTIPAIAGGAALAVGKKIVEFPTPKVILLSDVYMNIAITSSVSNIEDDTPDVGIGTVIASGAVAVLSGTATFENVLTGQTATDCSGTPIVAKSHPNLLIPAGESRSLFINIADNWAASGDPAAGLAGKVVLQWTILE